MPMIVASDSASREWPLSPPSHGGFHSVGIKFSKIQFSFFWKAFKTPKSERKFQAAGDLTFERETPNCGEVFTGLSPSTTPFGKRKFYEDS
jgi:hypothetical protein